MLAGSALQPNDHIRLERRERVLWVTFDRPEARNAMTFAMYERLYELCEEIDRDAELRCVVLTGSGERAFAAGTDINEFRAFKDGQDALRYERRIDEILTRIEAVRIPIVAAIRGACTGGGAGIAAACDLRIAGPSARFGYPVARTIGNCLSVANYARLERVIGAGAVKQLVYTAELFDARRMHELGFVDEVTASDEDVLPRVAALAETIAANAPLTIAVTKESLRRVARGERAGGQDLLLTCYSSEDFREGIEAFFAKRPARWQDR